VKGKNENIAANAAIRNTHTTLNFNPNASFEVKIETFNDTVNAGFSAASRKVAEIGGPKRIECLSLVDIDTGKEVFFEEGDEISVGSRKFWDFIKEYPDNNFAFIHNHNSDGYFSETDLRTLLYNNNIKMFGAIRID